MDKEVLEKLQALGEAYGGGDGLDYSGLGFTERDAPALLTLAKGEHLKESQADDEEAWDADDDVMIHAARALASFQNVEHLDSLLDLLRRADRNQDEFFLEEFPYWIQLMGSGVSQALREQLAKREETEGFRISVLEALEGEPVEQGGKEELMAVLAELLEARHPDYSFNAFAVNTLINLGAKTYIDVVRKALEADVIDQSVCGDLEDIEIGLGIREGRETIRPDYSSLREKYRRMTKKAELGELDGDAGNLDVLKYYLALYGLPGALVRGEQLDGLILAAILAPTPVPFSKLISTAWSGKEEGDQPGWEDQGELEQFYAAFMDYYNDIVDHLERESYEPILSVVRDEDGKALVVYAMWLTGFGLGLSQWHDSTPPTKAMTDALLDCVRKIFAHELDEDTGHTEAPDEVIQRLVDNVYSLYEKNKELVVENFSHHSDRQKVGRNEPCPCGSGKKFKRCCMGSKGTADNLISLN
jgi:yecA family protein